MGFSFPDAGPRIPVYNSDGTIAGYIDEDEYGNRIDGNYVKRSIWDDNDEDEDNPAEDYQYRQPAKVPLNKPQGFWGGGGGNPWWGGATSGQRWGDDPSGGYDARSGLTDAKQGSTRYSGIGPDAERKIKELKKKYNNVRHPTRRIKARIKSELSQHIPKAQVKKVMKDQNWL